jgi:hypothetical protein
MRLNTISDNTEKIILDIFGFPFILIRPLLVTIFRPSHLTRVIFFTDSWALRFARPSTYMFASLFPLTVIALADAHVLAAPANEAGLPLLRSVTLAEGRSFSVWSALPTLALPLGIVLIACHLLSWIISDRPRIRQRARCAMLYAFGTQAFLIGGTLLVFGWLKGLADTALSVEQFIHADLGPMDRVGRGADVVGSGMVSICCASYFNPHISATCSKGSDGADSRHVG